VRSPLPLLEQNSRERACRFLSPVMHPRAAIHSVERERVGAVIALLARFMAVILSSNTRNDKRRVAKCPEVKFIFISCAQMLFPAR